MRKYYALRSEQVSNTERYNQEKVRKLAGECAVILENDGVLPLKHVKRVALYGNGARHTIKGGTGSGEVNTRKSITIEQGLSEAGIFVRTRKWLDCYDNAVDQAKKQYMENMEKLSDEQGIPVSMLIMDHVFVEPPVPIIENEVSDLPEADAAVYVLARNSGEGADRKCEQGDYLLEDNELRNIRTLAEAYSHFILLLNVGSVVDTSQLKEIKGINAVVLIGQMGNLGGYIVADILLGKTIPSGKLTDTWAMRYEDYPSSISYGHRNGNLDDEYYTEGIYVGYRYFETFDVEPAYCFGYGKGYTDFDWHTEDVHTEGNNIVVEVKVKNTGTEYAGREVIQVYISAPEGKLEKPYQELKGFAKTACLKPGEEQTLTIRFPVESLASYDQMEAAWILEEGDYIVRVGNSSRNTEGVAVLYLERTVKTAQLRNVLYDAGDVKELRKNHVEDKEEKINCVKRIGLDDSAICTEAMKYQEERPVYNDRHPDKVLTLKDVKDKKVTIEELIAQLTVEELAALCVGECAGENNPDMIWSASSSVPGAAGETTSVLKESRKVLNLTLADGPAGLRLYPHFITESDGTLLPGGCVFGMDVEPFPEYIPEDAVHYYQYCTAIPIATTLAQSWDQELLMAMGEIVGAEMEQYHVHLWLAPGMNIHRNPLCGRNFEYYSEDPLLSGKCASADTQGVQTRSGHGITIKHFAANNQEDNRLFNNSHVSERTLREIYLKGFEIAVKEAQPYAVMSSYNLLNGTHAANHYGLLQSVLRDEWKFEGVVMTDWFTSQDVSEWGLVSDVYPISSSVLCIKAGNDLQMPGCKKNVEDIVNAVQNGKEITIGDLQFCAGNILKTILKCMGSNEELF